MNLYNFKEDLISKLPEGCIFKRIYSVDQTESKIETIYQNKTKIFRLMKKDISDLINENVVISISKGSSYNDLYKLVSDTFSLGLEEKVDYYNPNKVILNNGIERFVQLPISPDSYGYFGSISIYVIDTNSTFPIKLGIKDLRRQNLGYTLSLLKIRSLLATKIFSLDTVMFIDGEMSSELKASIAEVIMEEIDEFFYYYNFEEDFANGNIIDLFNDGFSDIMVYLTETGELLYIRFKSNKGDLPVIKEIVLPEEPPVTEPEDGDEDSGLDVDDGGEIIMRSV